MHTARGQLRPRNSGTIRIGFVPLIDAAPLIATLELGFFAAEGIDVTLHRELGWANVRDKLAYGRLDASHALIGMPIVSALQPAAGDPVKSVMALGSGGDAITISSRLVKAGVTNATTLGQYISQAKGGRPLVFGHVFDSSVHHYLLRDWLTSGGIDPDRDVRLCVLPPSQMPAHLAGGHVDGFCVGEPWNSVAQTADNGKIIALTTDLLPAHPDKVLAVNGRWAHGSAVSVECVIRAVIRGCQYCSSPANVDALAEMLSRPAYLNAPADLLASSLRMDRRVGPDKVSHLRPSEWQMRSFDTTFPSITQAAWYLSQMQRWGHADVVEPCEVAARATDTRYYRAAALAMDIGLPSTDTPPMPLRSGRLFECSPFLEGTLV